MTLKESLNSERILKTELQQLVPGAQLDWRTLPGTELTALVLTEESANRPLPPEVSEQVMDTPPFWSLVWPAGVALCRVLTRSHSLLRGRSVVDLGCGSGLVSAAATRAGGAVLAADVDPLSLQVARLNCLRNSASCRIEDHWTPSRCDLLLLADFLYDESNLELVSRCLPLCEEILVVDSRLKELPNSSMVSLGVYEGEAFPDLDPHREFGTLRVWYKGTREEEWRAVFRDCSFRVGE